MIRHCIHCTEGGLVNIRTYNNQLATFRLILCHGGSYIISQYKNESQKLGSDGTCRSLNDHMVIRPILFHVSLDYKMCAGLCNIPLLYIRPLCIFQLPTRFLYKGEYKKVPLNRSIVLKSSRSRKRSNLLLSIYHIKYTQVSIMLLHIMNSVSYQQLQLEFLNMIRSLTKYS